MRGSMLLQLTYVSTASPQFNSTEIDQLLTLARARNAKLGLNGILLFNGINFLQTLEGVPAAVAEVMASIRRDARHSGLVVVSRAHRSQPLFDGWRMGWQQLDASPVAAGVTEWQNSIADSALPAGLPPELTNLYRSFDSLSG